MNVATSIVSHHPSFRLRPRILLLSVLLLSCLLGQAQSAGIQADLTLIDGIELTADNIFNFRISNPTGQVRQVDVSGRVHYRRSNLFFTYRFHTTVQPGMNNISRSMIPNPQWSFSEPGLRDLFLTYNKLPQGTYEYCVTVVTTGAGAESAESDNSSCVYQTVEDMFLINLVTPENDAKIYEYNPMLGWVVNYPFASELTYKLRVAELKQGQNPQNAITRNNPVYRDDHVMTTGTIYPVTARPLQKWQPYVWTVDAYYKGILLGGAEVWKFTIIDDSELVAAPVTALYIDIRNEIKQTRYDAVGKIFIKYVLDDKNEEVLKLQLRTKSGKEIKMSRPELKAVLGDNRFELDLEAENKLRHMQEYILAITNGKGEVFDITIRYQAPQLTPQ